MVHFVLISLPKFGDRRDQTAETISVSRPSSDAEQVAAQILPHREGLQFADDANLRAATAAAQQGLISEATCANSTTSPFYPT